VLMMMMMVMMMMMKANLLLLHSFFHFFFCSSLNEILVFTFQGESNSIDEFRLTIISTRGCDNNILEKNKSRKRKKNKNKELSSCVDGLYKAQQ
jgi:hypothetical protein